eukprot:1394426-Amorphochlora_amoeboformis.AAC.1
MSGVRVRIRVRDRIRLCITALGPLTLPLVEADMLGAILANLMFGFARYLVGERVRVLDVVGR